jgi:hypothetical protein
VTKLPSQRDQNCSIIHRPFPTPYPKNAARSRQRFGCDERRGPAQRPSAVRASAWRAAAQIVSMS